VPRRKVVNGAPVEEQRTATIDRDSIPRHEAGVAREEPHIAIRLHRGVDVAHQELVIVVDGDRGRALADWHAFQQW